MVKVRVRVSARPRLDRRVLISQALAVWAGMWWLRRAPFPLFSLRSTRKGFARWHRFAVHSCQVEAALGAAAEGWDSAVSKLRGLEALCRHARMRMARRTRGVRGVMCGAGMWGGISWGVGMSGCVGSGHAAELARLASLATGLKVLAAACEPSLSTRRFRRLWLWRRGWAGFTRRGRERRAREVFLKLLVWRQWRRFCSLQMRYHRLLSPLRHAPAGGGRRGRWDISTHVSRPLCPHRTTSKLAVLRLH